MYDQELIIMANPNDLVYNPTEDPSYERVKPKIHVRDIALHEAAIKPYFYQIQSTMYCTQQKCCDIVVRTQYIYIEWKYHDNIIILDN